MSSTTSTSTAISVPPLWRSRPRRRPRRRPWTVLATPVFALLMAVSLAPAPAANAQTAASAAAASLAAEAGAAGNLAEPGGPVIDTFAGGGVGDGGPAIEALVSESVPGMAADGDGNLYVADAALERVRKVSSDGVITTIANREGHLRRGYRCARPPDEGGCDRNANADIEPVDGLPALEAGLNLSGSAGSLAADRDGNVFVLEDSQYICALHRIDTAGMVKTIIGSAQGCLRVGGPGDDRPFDGPVESATMSNPKSLAVGPDGSVYFLDQPGGGGSGSLPGADWVVRRIDPSLSTVATVAGGGEREPGDGVPATDARIFPDRVGGRPHLAVDPDGALHIYGYGSGYRIWRVDELGRLQTVAGDGECCERRDGEDATDTFVGDVRAMVFVEEGGRYEPGLYFHDEFWGFAGLRRISADGKVYNFSEHPELWGSGQNYSMAVDSAGTLFAAGGGGVFGPSDELKGMRVYRVDPDGSPTAAVGNGLSWSYGEDGVSAREAGFGWVYAIATDAAGNVYVRDSGYSVTVRRIDAETGRVTRVAGKPGVPDSDKCPHVVSSVAGLTSGPNPVVRESAREATICGGYVGAIAVDSAGNVYVTAGNVGCASGRCGPTFAHLLRVDALTGTTEEVFYCRDPRAGCGVIGIHIDDSDSVFISQANGTISRLAAPYAAVPIAVMDRGGDLAGDGQGSLYATSGHTVVRIDSETGATTRVAGTGEAGFAGDGGPATEAQLNAPMRVAVDPDGNLFIIDGYNLRVRRVDAETGVITTVVGSGACCAYDPPYAYTGVYAGDGGPATEASLRYPKALAFTPDGRLLIADMDRVRVVG